ncbi:hypothetical protein [Phytoactinopolyspora mesophila]|uniref:Bacterial transcriptional activator domain-containing protein n=1 Tax=Phytoactinopolyspora mesophila TaxID=2650750 RepID=A0A7K3M6R4_9ACTN|nr:hypothetical protein [Phytoactinopolyspora mesophila]NDL58920.1 hypothetical protein [Phytoactinopolyspora mesophila]
MSQLEQPPPPPPPPVPANGEPVAPRETGPQRFQHKPDPAGQQRSLPRALAAALALAVLVAGVPIGLLVLAGHPPIPTSLPTRDDLTATIGADQLIGVLLWIVWLAWLQFTICVLVELRSAVRGIGLPTRVPMGGASQRLARVLVGSVLLAATAVGQASAAVPATAAEAPASVGVSVSSLSDASDGMAQASGEKSESAPQSSSSHERTGEEIYRLGDMVLDPDEGAELVGQKVYVVQPPEGRYHDNLWDIAERTLGDGRRYQEIFELNRGRTQPDGHELSLARLIYPNWLLILPNDATDADVVTVEQPEESAAEEAAGSSPGDSSGAGGESSGAEGEATGSGDAHAGSDTEAADVESGGRELSGENRGSVVGGQSGDTTSILDGTYRDLAVAGLLSAGVLAAIELVRRRRRTPQPGDDEADAEVALRVGADPDRARWLDYALRSLAAACRESDVPLPPVYAVFVDNTAVELMLAPARPEAPAPWSVSDDGRRWTLHRERMVGSGDPAGVDMLAPYPGLVSLGRDGDRDVLVDLEAAGGPISIAGDPGVAFEVVTAIAVELATNRWSDQLRVTAEGLPDELTVFDPGQLRLVDDIEGLLPEVAARQAGFGPDVLSGRLRPGRGGAWMPEYLVLGTQPSEDVVAQLLQLTSSSSRSPLGVVFAGEVTGARWRLSVDSSGTLEVPALGLSLRANQLSWRSIEAIAALVEPDRSGGGDGPGAPVLHEAWLPEVRPQVPEPPKFVEVAHLATAPVRVFVLGPVEVQAAQDIDPERRALATEMVVYLALHPEGVHPTVLAAALWPRGVTAAVREASFARVRDWLGVDPDGSPYLLTTADGKLKLSEDVVLDWDVVCALLRRARDAHAAKDEIDLLRQALRVARGPVLAERPQGRYGWIARARLERTASDVLVDAAHRLSMLCGGGGDPATAAAAARAGLRVRPGEQLLWRDLLQAQRMGDATRVPAVADEMSAALTELGVDDIEPETGALLDELLPGSNGAQSAHRRRRPAS